MRIGTPFPSPEHCAVTGENVRSVVDRVAVVVARERYAARYAVGAVVVDYDPLPVAVDREMAMTCRPAILHVDFANNFALGLVLSGTGVGRQWDIDDTAADTVFEVSAFVTAQRIVNQRLAPCSIEAREVVAQYEPRREALTIWSGTQNPHIRRTLLAQKLGLGEERVRTVAPEVSGGFGAKMNICGEEVVAAALSKRLGLPIKWIEDRSGSIPRGVHGGELLAYVELAAAKLLGVVKDLIYRWIEHNALPVHNVGRPRKFKLSVVDASVRAGGAGSEGRDNRGREVQG